MASPPQNLSISLPFVPLPCADATQCFHERPWGWVGAASARGLALSVQFWPQKGLSTPNTSHFHLQHAPLMSWRHTMLPWTTLGLGWGCISSGEGPSNGLHGNSKSDAVLYSCSIICVLFINYCCTKKRNVMGQHWSQTAKLRSKLYCTVALSLYSWDRTFQTDRTSTVLYGVNTVRTV